MAILLSRIVEQQGTEGQYYDLGRDFANFRRTIDGTSDQIKQKFEQAIGKSLVGKRIKARASRGYKQYVKDYEFDVMKVTLDDYYDNYVVVAHDNTTPKAKEYFLKPGFKIQILGPATGQPSPQKGDKPGDQKPEPQPPVNNNASINNTPSQQMVPAPAGNTPSEQPVKENDENGYYDAYSIDDIAKDIKPWLLVFLKKPPTSFRDFIKGVGWIKKIDDNTTVSMFDVKLPIDLLNREIQSEVISTMFSKLNNQNVKYDLVKMNLNDANDEWQIRIKKTTTK